MKRCTQVTDTVLSVTGFLTGEAQCRGNSDEVADERFFQFGQMWANLYDPVRT